MADFAALQTEHVEAHVAQDLECGQTPAAAADDDGVVCVRCFAIGHKALLDSRGRSFVAQRITAVDVAADIGLVGHGLALREGGAVLGDHLCPGGALALLELVVFGEQPQHAPVVAGPGLGLDRFDQRMAEIVPVR